MLSKIHLKMKKLIVVLTLFCICCTSKESSKEAVFPTTKSEQRNENEKESAALLLRNDFLKYADETKKDSLKTAIQNSFMIYDENTFKFATIDAEELAEFNFDHFLPQLTQMLKKRGILFTLKTADDYDKTYDVLINDQRLKLYTQNDLEKDFWSIASKNLFSRLNQLLARNNSKEKFYLLYEGNDLSTLLLTEEQFEIIKQNYSADSNEIPYLP
jgi:hypothetical protein